MLCWCRRLCTSSDSTWCQQRAVLFTRGFDWQIPSSSRCTSQLNQASADNNDHDNYKAQGDEQIHPMCYVGRVNSWYQRPAKTLIVKPFLHKFCQMYIMGCYCWDLLPPAWLDAGLLHGYCSATYLLLQVHWWCFYKTAGNKFLKSV